MPPCKKAHQPTTKALAPPPPPPPQKAPTPAKPTITYAPVKYPTKPTFYGYSAHTKFGRKLQGEKKEDKKDFVMVKGSGKVEYVSI